MNDQFSNHSGSQHDENEEDKANNIRTQWQNNNQTPQAQNPSNSTYYPQSYLPEQYPPFYPPASQAPYVPPRPTAGVSPYPVWQMSTDQPHPNPNPYCGGHAHHPSSTAGPYVPLAPQPGNADQMPTHNQTVVQDTRIGTNLIQGPLSNVQLVQQPFLAPPAAPQAASVSMWPPYAVPYPSDPHIPSATRTSLQPETPMSDSNTPSTTISADSRNESEHLNSQIGETTNDNGHLDKEPTEVAEQSLFSDVIGDRLIKSLKAASASRNNNKDIIPPNLVRAMSGRDEDDALDSRTLTLKNIASIYKSWDDHETGSQLVLEYLKPLWEEQLNAYLKTARYLYYNNHYRCRKCEAPVSYTEFWKHIFPDHGDADIMPLKCLFCVMQFNVPRAWETHVMGCYNLTIFLVSQLEHVWQVSMIRNFLVGHLSERMESFRASLIEEYHERFS